MNRDQLLKLTRILNWVTAGLMVLLLVSFALPYFKYSGGEQDVISIWGYLGFPANFEQMEDLLDVRFLTIANLNVVLAMIVFGVLSIIFLLRKKGIATQLLPLVWVIWGIVGYLLNDFLLMGNTFAYYVQFAIIVITAVVVVVNIIMYIKELSVREAHHYMDLDAWS